LRTIRVAIFFCLFLIFTHSSVNEKSKIINNLNNIDNIQFKFTQTTNENIEKGRCILAFPGKLKCDYKDKNEKELIVNKKMMAITQKRYGKTLFYPLSKSTFINILSKNELIKIINESSTFIDDYINIIFIDKNNIKTLIKFDKNKFLLAGWTSSDQYNNQIVFEIEITSVNQMINNNVFTLPSKS
jgi:outer membrane lipoprotein-sorting protein